MTLGQYIVRFCDIKGITLKQFTRGCKYSDPYTDLSKRKYVTIKYYFAMAEYMAKISGLPEQFYLKRLKDTMQGKLTCRDLSL